MSFMQPEIECGDYFVVETKEGLSIVPAWLVSFAPDADELRDYCQGQPIEWERKTGVYARLSAPGYMDCTDWQEYASEQEAREGLAGDYGTDEDEIDEDEQADEANDHVDLEY